MKRTTYDVIVVGGGAAGMLASAIAAERGLQTLVVEKNDRCGRKLRITGKGRCNVTNDAPPVGVIENIPTGGKFLYGAVFSFPPEKVMDEFRGMGVELKTERGNRVFPVSDRAEDVVDALKRRMDRAGVTVVRATAREILTENGACSGVRTDRGDYLSHAVVMCTGGASYPGTGSDGSGYEMARRAGHTVCPIRPSLVPLCIEGPDCSEMQGLSLRNVRLTAETPDGRTVYREQGEMLFTHFGVSGPLVLSASAHMRDGAAGCVLHIDLKPALDEGTLDARILRDFSAQPNRDLANVLGGLVNRKMIPVVVRRLGVPGDRKIHDVTREERKRLVSLLKDMTLYVTGPRPISEAIVTSGGVDTAEVDPRTMESKRVRGLYFAGEILNCDAYTGGFNLQIAWSTAHAAATHVACG
ncbi:MAG: NAD(P)/FAD-dependent oxidoreductase [Oscillospiraceae bacterium]|nr:NAD(P)/FAD-dependent oxidoreductase [Oscillospiraceae bacterium]